MTRSKHEGFQADARPAAANGGGSGVPPRAEAGDHAFGGCAAAFIACVSQFKTPRAWLLAAMHAVVFAAAYYLAYLLRFDFGLSAAQMVLFWATWAGSSASNWPRLRCWGSFAAGGAT